jgi:hypothetical protein
MQMSPRQSRGELPAAKEGCIYEDGRGGKKVFPERRKKKVPGGAKKHFACGRFFAPLF